MITRMNEGENGGNHCSMKFELIGAGKKISNKLWGYSRKSDSNPAANFWGGMTGSETSELVHIRGSMRKE